MWLESIRDIAIVLLALESLVIGVLLLVTVVQIRKLLSIMRDELIPMLTSVKDTAHTVKGTANIVSQTVVSPLVKLNSFTAGLAQVARTWRSVHRVRRTPEAPDSAE